MSAARLVAFDGLPPVFSALMGSVYSSFPPEPLSTCSNCALKPRPGLPDEVSWAPAFPAAARCCTYHPDLPAYAVGSALRRGGLGAEKIRARMADLDGVMPGGIRRAARYRERQSEQMARFGHDDILQCPYFSTDAPEGFGCTIHLDREAICRSWHCRFEGGARGQAVWVALKELFICIEDTLIAECLASGLAPEEGASVEAWEVWFLWCAEHIDALAEVDFARLRGERLNVLLDTVRQRADERNIVLPEIVIPTVRSWTVHNSGVTLISCSSYDPFESPSWIFELLSRLDGRTPWRRAKAETEALLRAPVGDDLVLSMFRRGLLGPPEHTDAPPGMSIMSRASPGG